MFEIYPEVSELQEWSPVASLIFLQFFCLLLDSVKECTMAEGKTPSGKLIILH